ncbi:hypothetical protein SERLADRAFT_464293 [Serpula lacrymans var. lacrymans S7.9]|uniref:Uncharacterized protein n=1 Tax=Serpula lacrymans var. lacrymans (strain S7.9) TaxID=578457 RepID=F8NRT0_SERL9|nr:uncharacterized protein SERLADRAFT_464293 [Serpula lacrymans var. lacrymans S7.9]EGO26816.1 hypothetical protein SERLADRAFT_464293 [Serpula lacrymans var. lacrymans S7.9]
MLLEDNEDIVEVGAWEETKEGAVLRASTDWIEHRDAHGLEKFEPARNVEIMKLPEHAHDDNALTISQSVLSIIQSPFHVVSDIIDPQCPPSAVLTNLLASPYSPLYTALIFITTSVPSPAEYKLLDALALHIPMIVLPELSDNDHHSGRLHLSSFCPRSGVALRSGLFRSPETISMLRFEAAERFLRWREVEREVKNIAQSRKDVFGPAVKPKSEEPVWDKAEWEAQWDHTLSKDVTRRLREDTITARPVISMPCMSSLHFPSLFLFSLSLLEPARDRLGRSVSTFVGKVANCHLGLAMVGSLCVGIGIGFLLK